MLWQPLGMALIIATASVSLSLINLKAIYSRSVPKMLWNLLERTEFFL